MACVLVRTLLTDRQKMKVFSLYIGLLLSVLLTQDAATALQWSAVPKDNWAFAACEDRDVTLGWHYALDPGDVISSTKWYFEDRRSRELVAVSVDGSSFIATASFSNRVERANNAGITLNHVVEEDSGNYSVVVTGHDGSGVSFTSSRRVLFQVAGYLTDHELQASQQAAEYDNSTDQWHTVLTCGHFTFKGEPIAAVEWLTPEGQTLPSTLYSQGVFKLFLPNPVTEGNYTCRISASAKQAFCTHSYARQASVEVNGFMTRLTLMEAKQGRLEAEQERLSAENVQKDAVINELTTKVNSMQATNVQLTTKVDSMEAENVQLMVKVNSTQAENVQLMTKVNNLQNVTVQLRGDMDSMQAKDTQKDAVISELRTKVDSMQTELSRQTKPVIAFNARLSSDTEVQFSNSPATLVLSDVLLNLGDAYSKTTGRFTAPVTGTYYFSAMAGATLSSGFGGDVLWLRTLAGPLFMFLASGSRDGNSQTLSLQGTTRLQQGEQVWLMPSGPPGASIHFFSGGTTVWGGFLIFAE